jgi:hypothetical protein
MIVSSQRGAMGNGVTEGGWLLGGTAELAADPENPSNDVIRIRTDVEPFFGTVSRTVNVKADRLDNMLEFKSWFSAAAVIIRPDLAASGAVASNKTCAGGSPRFELAIDLDGDGVVEGNAFGYTGADGSGLGCPGNTWLYEDLTGGDSVAGLGIFPSPPFATTNEESEWTLEQLGGPGLEARVPWSEVETFLKAYPGHVVCTVSLVDDTLGLPGMSGTAYYDVISGGRSTWANRADIAGRGFARGCARPAHDDDDHEFDKDRDHDEDHDDEKYDRDRRERWKG